MRAMGAVYPIRAKRLQEFRSDCAFNQTTRNRVRERAQKCEMDKFIQSTSNACKKFVQIGLLNERHVLCVRERAQKCEMDKFIQSTSNACKKFVQIGLLNERHVLCVRERAQKCEMDKFIQAFLFFLSIAPCTTAVVSGIFTIIAACGATSISSSFSFFMLSTICV